MVTPQAGDAPTESTVGLERLGRDRIKAFIAERFAGQGLSDLVVGVLNAEGFSTEEAWPKPYSGIDILAGGGPLGLDSTRLIVRVEPGAAPVDIQTVRQMHGTRQGTYGAEEALLVAWGGVTDDARQEARSQTFRFSVWDADDLLDAVLRNYDNLSEELRAGLPLKRVWSLVSE